jgi:hypothetical protein
MSVIPYDQGDRLTEAELAARLGITPRAMRARRQNGTAGPYSIDGKTIIYSWSRYLEHLRRNERQPVRSRRRVEQAAAQR